MASSATLPSDLAEDSGIFRVALGNFDGPFDLLLRLIGKRELDITEIALSAVTDEFMAHVRGLATEDELNQASEFIVVAATLLDLKIAGLLPQGEVVDAEEAALLEARDILFARLLQYRAFKEVSDWFADHLEAQARRHPRSVRLEERFRSVTPVLSWTLSAADFGALAAIALAPRAIPTVGIEHLHAPLVSIREQAAILVERLRGGDPHSFRELLIDAGEIAARGVIIARFLAILELYRTGAVLYDQADPLGDLVISWCADPEWTADNLAQLGAEDDHN